MKLIGDSLRGYFFFAFVLIPCLSAFPSGAADYPAPSQGEWVVRDFRFHTGEVLPELRLHYTTVGARSGEPVLILHGSTGAGTNMLNANFAGELFGSGQPLDANRYFIILPDALGARKSSMAYELASQNTTTTISCRRNIDWSPSI
jgi:homoserine O-acetyltransferase